MINVVCINQLELNWKNNIVCDKRLSQHHIYNILYYLLDYYNWQLCLYEDLEKNCNDISNFFISKYKEIPNYFIMFENSFQIYKWKFPDNLKIINICVDTIFRSRKNIYKTKCFNKCDAVFSCYGYNIQK